MSEFKHNEYLNTVVVPAIQAAGFEVAPEFPGRTNGRWRIAHSTHKQAFALLDVGFPGSFGVSIELCPLDVYPPLKRHYKFRTNKGDTPEVNVKGLLAGVKDELNRALMRVELARQSEAAEVVRRRLQKLNQPLVDELLQAYGLPDKEGDRYIPGIQIEPDINEEGKVVLEFDRRNHHLTAAHARAVIEALKGA